MTLKLTKPGNWLIHDCSPTFHIYLIIMWYRLYLHTLEYIILTFIFHWLTNSDRISNLLSVGFMAFFNLTNITHLALLLTSTLRHRWISQAFPFLWASLHTVTFFQNIPQYGQSPPHLHVSNYYSPFKPPFKYYLYEFFLDLLLRSHSNFFRPLLSY